MRSTTFGRNGTVNTEKSPRSTEKRDKERTNIHRIFVAAQMHKRMAADISIKNPYFSQWALAKELHTRSPVARVEQVDRLIDG